MVLCGRSPVGSSSRARGWVSEAAAGPAEGGRGRGTAKVGDEVRAQSEGHSSACTRRRGMQAPSVAAVASSATAAREVLEAGEEGRGERAPRADGRRRRGRRPPRRGGQESESQHCPQSHYEGFICKVCSLSGHSSERSIGPVSRTLASTGDEMGGRREEGYDGSAARNSVARAGQSGTGSTANRPAVAALREARVERASSSEPTVNTTEQASSRSATLALARHEPVCQLRRRRGRCCRPRHRVWLRSRWVSRSRPHLLPPPHQLARHPRLLAHEEGQRSASSD